MKGGLEEPTLRLWRQVGTPFRERLVLRFELRNEAGIVSGLAQGGALLQTLDLMTDHRHRILDLLAEGLV
ncbi:hypothetical protein [Acidisoma sp. 7E03]